MVAHEMPYLTILLEKLSKVRKISGVKVLCGHLERQTLKRGFNFTCQLIRGWRGIILCIPAEPTGDGWTGQRNKVGNSKRQGPGGKANVPAPSPCYQSYHRVTTSMAASGQRYKNFAARRCNGVSPGARQEGTRVRRSHRSGLAPASPPSVCCAVGWRGRAALGCRVWRRPRGRGCRRHAHPRHARWQHPHRFASARHAPGSALL
jgi:hypothetical protein